MELIIKEEKHISFIQRPKLSKNMLFGADAYIYKAKKSNKSLKACNATKWDLYNSILLT